MGWAMMTARYSLLLASWNNARISGAWRQIVADNAFRYGRVHGGRTQVRPGTIPVTTAIQPTC